MSHLTDHLHTTPQDHIIIHSPPQSNTYHLVAMTQTDCSASPFKILPAELNPVHMGPLGLLLGLAYLSRGTFGIIYGKAGGMDLVKVVEHMDNGDALEVEFEL